MKRASPSLRACLGALLASAPLVVLAAPAGAEGEAESKASEPRAEQGPGWTVNCASSGQGMACKAQQTIVLTKTRQRLLQLSVSRAEDGETMTLLFHLPHGLYNPAGVVTAVDGAEGETLVIQTCDAQGCYAGSSMPPARFAALVKGTSLAVTFQDLKKQQITVPVPLKGLDEAAKKL